MSKCGIYQIINNANGKSYIGQSIDIDRRFRQHVINATNKKGRDYGKPLYQAMRNFGMDKFEFIILEECTFNKLNEREIYYINKFISYKNGYNGTPGGRNVNFRQLKNKVKMTEEDVVQIRNDYLSGMTIAEVYLIYNQKISLEDFHQIWIGESYPAVHMDVYTDESRDFHRENDEIDYIPRFYTNKILNLKNAGERMPFAYQQFNKFLSYDMFKSIWEEGE
jgi:hypothetical protein